MVSQNKKSNYIIMDVETINYTAENQILSNLCLEYYNESDEEKKKILFEKIQVIYTKKNKIISNLD
jgi:hypothetical protein